MGIKPTFAERSADPWDVPDAEIPAQSASAGAADHWATKANANVAPTAVYGKRNTNIPPPVRSKFMRTEDATAAL